MIIGPEGVRAVLDWELTHVDDLIEHLGWVCAGPWRFGAVGLRVGGFGAREDLWPPDERTSGEKVNLPNL